MLEYDFDASIGYWLTTTHQAYMRAFQERLAPYGITFRQAQVLGWLAYDGPMSQTDLASRMLIEPPSLVGILDRAEEAGLIERRACEVDRRRKLVHLLPASEGAWQLLVRCGREMRNLACDGLSDEEVETLKYLLGKVRQNVATSTPVAK